MLTGNKGWGDVVFYFSQVLDRGKSMSGSPFWTLDRTIWESGGRRRGTVT